MFAWAREPLIYAFVDWSVQSLKISFTDIFWNRMAKAPEGMRLLGTLILKQHKLGMSNFVLQNGVKIA